MRLVPARLDDCNTLVTLDASAGGHPWSVLALQNALTEGRVWGIETDGRLAGFLVAETVLDETTLLHLAVGRDDQGRGLARAALGRWLNELARIGQQRCLLEVRVDNAPARALYQRLAFAVIGRRRGYYSDGEDALVMARELA